MADVEFDHVSKIYDNGFMAVNELSLRIDDGEFLVLVGPSGCGKSTALRMVAGLEDISEGELRIDNERMNEVQPRERDIAMVFQSYALYPHLTVAENIGFGLTLRKMPKQEINARVRKAAATLGLVDLLERRPKMLSGGQRQRVAMGRAIVREPKVFLMDEPLSNLDAKLRVQMRAEIAKLQHDMGITTVYVTHDQVEAMTMADRVAVMRRGVLQQVDTPYELYDRPANLFVAGFIGSPAMNLLAGRVSVASGQVSVRIGDQTLDIAPAAVAAYPELADANGRDVTMGIRPEFFTFPAEQADPGQRLEIMIDLVESTGSETHVHFALPVAPVDTDDTRDLAEHAGDTVPEKATSTVVVAKLDGLARVRLADRISLGVNTGRCHFFDAATGAPLR
ncbi:MAG: sn-glycerol-3-phosphate ABC transporter ATP-binding protein UgpC [Actinomycetota bacterium]|nr:sn-glycerol-3-phosphate ABC transporter ATP-binding protein UgpC [Actinomycetota bacterium]